MTDAGHALCYGKGKDALAIRVPGGDIGFGVIVHFPRAGNAQHAVLAQRPGQAAATGAGIKDARFQELRLRGCFRRVQGDLDAKRLLCPGGDGEKALLCVVPLRCGQAGIVPRQEQVCTVRLRFDGGFNIGVRRVDQQGQILWGAGKEHLNRLLRFLGGFLRGFLGGLLRGRFRRLLGRLLGGSLRFRLRRFPGGSLGRLGGGHGGRFRRRFRGGLGGGNGRLGLGLRRRGGR